jgi:hypothetical protein
MGRPKVHRLATALAAATLAAGCAGSVLVRRDDTTFSRSLAALDRTRAEVEAIGAAREEAALFLQAEALYRYRFDPPARGFGNYLAQTLAVASEFAPLQAMAASAGMFGLRLRVYDGAVQLWETLLDRHPATPLRPLVLYRLGWAYRSAGTGGLPRDSGDQAWDELVAQQPAAPLGALASAARRVPWKSQDTAIELSIVPGVGQMYAGEYGNGTARLAVAIACAALIIVPAYLLYRNISERDGVAFRQDWPYVASSFAGIILLNVAYTTAYQDALRAAVQFNERQEAAFEARHPEGP